MTGGWKAGVGADAQCVEVAVPQVCWGAANRAGGASLAENGFEDVCISLSCSHFWNCFCFCPFSLLLFYSLLILVWMSTSANPKMLWACGREGMFLQIPSLPGSCVHHNSVTLCS